ncbi:ABC transporter substrate-binding protein [Desulfatiglans anilini]|uniref:ABC transporter substrate-binding protein n=1 Tax=Desulfatiglans anilini TaxID=90728 RepID=UPI0003F7D0B8|nr:ABC transporter substrate-binding protein [Desulfatiglans anilini]
MKGTRFIFGPMWMSLVLALFLVAEAPAQAPIVIGVPTSTGFVEGKEALQAVIMATEEINAKGGVQVGGEKRLLKVESIDIRDAAPGVPVPEALLGLEKMILDQKPTALVVGPFRSEALMAGMDILAKYKVPLIGTIAMSPASEEKIKQEPEKYRYVFRTCLNAKYLVKYLIGTMAFINEQFGFNKVYIMNQDVAWARKTAELMTELYFKKAGWEVLGSESYPTGTSDFSSALMKIRAQGAQVILPIFDMPQSGILVKQWHTMRVPALMAGFISPLAGPGAWKTFDAKIGGAVNCNFELGSAIASPKVPASQAYYDAYEKRWGKAMEAGHGPAPSYESVYILAEAIERAGTLDPDTLAAEIAKTDRQGVMGRIRFDEGHQAVYDYDPSEAAIAAVFQWTEDGKRVIVLPEAISEGRIQLPEGLKSLK